MRLTHFVKESKGILGIIGGLLILNAYLYGYLAGWSKISPKPIIFEPKTPPQWPLFSVSEPIVKPAGDLVASKSGTRVYYIWCSGVNRIKPENRRYFATLEEALKEGYKPASNCPGL